MQVLRGEYESMKRYLRFRNSSLRVLRAGFNGNDVIVNAIRRGNRNIRFARLFFPFSLPLSLSREGQEKRCYLGRCRSPGRARGQR